MPNSRTRTTSRQRSGTSGAFEVFRRPQRSIPVLAAVVVWRWRWELTVLALTVATFVALTNTGLTPILTVLAMLTVAVVILSVPFTRRFATTRIMCVLIRHRLRVCMSEMRTLNYSGYLPLILHIRGTPVGLVAWIWMRPGLAITDLDSRTEHLATACWAREVRIQRSRRLAALVRIDIVRRDPLVVATPITSPLLRDTAAIPAASPGELPESVLAGITQPTTTTGHAAHDTTADQEPATPTAKTRKTTKTTKASTAAASATDGPVVLINGEDVSDYV